MNKITQKEQELKVEELEKIDTLEATAETEMVEEPKEETGKEQIAEISIEELGDCCEEQFVDKDKVLNVIKAQKDKYKTKVVLALSEVWDILKAIETAVNE